MRKWKDDRLFFMGMSLFFFKCWTASAFLTLITPHCLPWMRRLSHLHRGQSHYLVRLHVQTFLSFFFCLGVSTTIIFKKCSIHNTVFQGRPLYKTCQRAPWEIKPWQYPLLHIINLILTICIHLSKVKTWPQKYKHCLHIAESRCIASLYMLRFLFQIFILLMLYINKRRQNVII